MEENPTETKCIIPVSLSVACMGNEPKNKRWEKNAEYENLLFIRVVESWQPDR